MQQAWTCSSKSFLNHNVNNRIPVHHSWGSGDLNVTEATRQSLGLTSQMLVRLCPQTHPFYFWEFLLGGSMQAHVLYALPFL